MTFMSLSTNRRRTLTVATVLLAAAAIAMRPQDSAPAKDQPGWKIVSVVDQTSSGATPAVLNQPSSALYRSDDNGVPVVSNAGFVQLKLEGEGFFYANILSNRRKQAEKRGEFDTENWGDVDAFRMFGRIVKRWRALHPQGPRLGVEDISSMYGGFPDYDKDGIADHRTHQLGSNINILIPCTVVPEVEVFFGVRNEDKFDAAGTQLLATMLFEEGAWSFTTTSATKVLEAPKPFPMKVEVNETTETGTLLYRVNGKHSVILMKDAKNHGNHFNARLTPIW